MGADVSLNEFMACVNMCHRFPSSLHEQLGAVIQVISGKVCKLFTASTVKLQPITVASGAKPVIAPWSALMEQLANSVGSTGAAVDAVIAKVQEGVACTLPSEVFKSNG